MTASLVVICAISRILIEVDSGNIKHQHMKELDITVINVILDYSLSDLSKSKHQSFQNVKFSKTITIRSHSKTFCLNHKY